MMWQEDTIWCRQMLDWVSTGRLIVADYKTTQESAAPHTLARKMAADGWAIQAAMAERGLAILDPDNIGRRSYLFVVQEAYVPYCLNVVEISESALTMGRKMLDRAVSIWTECVTQRRWPGYPLVTIVPDFPPWAEAEWLGREETEWRVETAGTGGRMADVLDAG